MYGSGKLQNRQRRIKIIEAFNAGFFAIEREPVSKTGYVCFKLSSCLRKLRAEGL